MAKTPKRKPRKPQKRIKARQVEPDTYVVQFSLTAAPEQFFYLRFDTRREALRFVNFEDRDVIAAASIL